ncbi:MAG: hypothetical protein IJO55_11770 [Lachnospiraceae bacterium]|nr:hypothetical protein [Lachnospiraceae bacterium]
MKSCKIKIFFIVLVLVTAIAAFAHLRDRQQIPEHTLLITQGEKEFYVDIDDLTFETVTGIRVNGKGEEIPVEAPGISIKDILTEVNVTEFEAIVIESDDSYQARVSKDETEEDGKAYLLRDERKLRLIVFGDENSKRSVSNVVKMIVE